MKLPTHNYRPYDAKEAKLKKFRRIHDKSPEQIFEAVVWLMARAKLVAEGAAAAPVGALLQGLVDAPPDTNVVAVLSGGNLDLEQLKGLRWN